eukprot:m.26567 g.26567  ORF g.26567 m.26567 type:complete len:337 (+) comp4616_c0_seq1:339-1349(+)
MLPPQPAPRPALPSGVPLPEGSASSHLATPSGVFNHGLTLDLSGARVPTSPDLVTPSAFDLALELGDELRTPEVNRLTQGFLRATASSGGRTPAPVPASAPSAAPLSAGMPDLDAGFLVPTCPSDLGDLIALSTPELLSQALAPRCPLELELLACQQQPQQQVTVAPAPTTLPDLEVPHFGDSSSPFERMIDEDEDEDDEYLSTSSTAPSPSGTDSEADYVPAAASPARRRRGPSTARKARVDRNLTASGQVRKRRPKQFVPDEKKDAKYWERRKKNNEAARRNRERKRQEQQAQKSHIEILDEQKKELVDEVTLLRRELQVLREAVRARFQQVCL